MREGGREEEEDERGWEGGRERVGGRRKRMTEGGREEEEDERGWEGG